MALYTSPRLPPPPHGVGGRLYLYLALQQTSL